MGEDFPKVKNIQVKSEVNDLLNFMITILNVKINTEIEQKNLDQQMVLVFDLIKTKFGNLTIPEIREAFKMYVSNEFDIKVFRILDCIVVGDVLRAFISFRNENLRIYSSRKNTLLQSANIKYSEKEVLAIREKFLKSIFDDLVEKGFSSDSWRLFQDLEDSGKLKISAIDKNSLYKKQLRLYELETKGEILSKHGKFSKPFLQDLKDKITGTNTIGSVVNRCRSITASNYLKEYTKDYETFKTQVK